jgi:Family of unknown function (DUF6062)
MAERKARPRSRFVAYYEMVEVLQQPGCPVCTRQGIASKRALGALLYEQATDPLTRRRLLGSRGLCNWHAWMLPEIRDSALGTALVYKHLLQDVLKTFPGLSEPQTPSRWQRFVDQLSRRREKAAGPEGHRGQRADCPVCRLCRRAERNDIRTILTFWAEPELAQAFGRSAGLCLPHLLACTQICRGHANLPSVLADHVRRFRELTEELEEFIRKRDYRFQREPYGPERDSWKRVLEVFVGQAGVFGPER